MFPPSFCHAAAVPVVGGRVPAAEASLQNLVAKMGTTLAEQAIAQGAAGLRDLAARSNDPCGRALLGSAASVLQAQGADGLRALVGLLDAKAKGRTLDTAALSQLSATELSAFATALQNIEAAELHAQTAGLRLLVTFVGKIGQPVLPGLPGLLGR